MMSANGTGTGDTGDDTGDDSYFDSQELETVIVTAVNTGTGDTWDTGWADSYDTRPTTTDPEPPYNCNCGGGGGETPSEDASAPLLKLSQSDSLKYPRLASMIKSLRTYVINDVKVMDALLEFTGYTRSEILNLLKYGNGPLVIINEATGRIGHFDRSTNTLELTASYVRGLELSVLSSTKQATSFLLAVTTLHEFVHYGRYNNNSPDGGYEYGWGFEEMAYGAIINKKNAYEYSIDFYKKSGQ